MIRPNARAEVAGRVLCEIEGGSLFANADAAREAVDLLIGEELFAEEAVDDHVVRSYYATGADLLEDFDELGRELPAATDELISALEEPVVLREPCRLRRLRRAEPPSTAPITAP